MPEPPSPYYKALESMRYWAAILGCKPSAIVVDNLPKPPLPDWDAERRAQSKE